MPVGTTKIDKTGVASVVKPKISPFDTPDRTRTGKAQEAAAKAAKAAEATRTGTITPMPKATSYSEVIKKRSEVIEEGTSRPKTRATTKEGDSPKKEPKPAEPTKGKKDTAPGQDKKNGKEKKDKEKSKYAGGGKYAQIISGAKEAADKIDTGPKSKTPSVSKGGVPGGGDSAEERRSSRLKKNVEKSKSKKDGTVKTKSKQTYYKPQKK